MEVVQNFSKICFVEKWWERCLRIRKTYNEDLRIITQYFCPSRLIYNTYEKIGSECHENGHVRMQIRMVNLADLITSAKDGSVIHKISARRVSIYELLFRFHE